MLFSEDYNYTKSFLNTIDLMPYLQVGKDLEDIMHAIKLTLSLKTDSETFEGLCAFECMEPVDFGYYLKERYGEEVILDTWEEMHYVIAGVN